MQRFCGEIATRKLVEPLQGNKLAFLRWRLEFVAGTGFETYDDAVHFKRNISNGQGPAEFEGIDR